jgi:hypothetical protein
LSIFSIGRNACALMLAGWLGETMATFSFALPSAKPVKVRFATNRPALAPGSSAWRLFSSQPSYLKKAPLSTAFDPPVHVTLIFTWPEMFQIT